MRKYRLTKFGKWTVAFIVNVALYAVLYVLATNGYVNLLLNIMYTLLGMFFVAVMSWNIYEYVYKPLKLESKLKSLRKKVKQANNSKSKVEDVLVELECHIEKRISSFHTEEDQIKCVNLYLVQKEVLEKMLHASNIIIDSCKMQLAIFDSLNPNADILIRNFNINQEFRDELNIIAADIDSEINKIAINIEAVENNIRESREI